MTQVKICGLRESEHVRAAIDAGADLLGFIFYRQVRRYVDPRLVAEMLREIPRGTVRAVGVFVNDEPSVIDEIVALCGLDLVQLSGDESPEFCHQITAPVAKTLHVGADIDLARLRAYQGVVAAVHLDTARSGQFGGTGATFDWKLARALPVSVPVLLAGGLCPDNVVQAVTIARPWAVDVSSGVEVAGRKETALIQEFVSAVRSADAMGGS